MDTPLTSVTKDPPIRAPELPVRALAIESVGDPWNGAQKPKIRLMGHWLKRAGFQPGQRVQVTCVSHGLIELRSAHIEAQGRKIASEF
jgi:hypothetical protein